MGGYALLLAQSQLVFSSEQRRIEKDTLLIRRFLIRQQLRWTLYSATIPLMTMFSFTTMHRLISNELLMLSLSTAYVTQRDKQEGTYYFGVEVNAVDDVTGKPIYSGDGRVLQKKIPMTGAKFVDGTPQSFYFSPPAMNPQVYSRE